MKRSIQYKRIFKCLSSSAIVIAEMLIFWLIWVNYYNEIIEFPFWRRGNWLMVVLYGILLLFFLKMYGGFKIGILKKGNVIGSQILAVCLVNGITYLQIALLDKKFHPLFAMLFMTCVDTVLIIMWAFLFQSIYGKLFPKKRLLLVYGDIPAFNLLEKINGREDKYCICGAIHVDKGAEYIIRKMDKFDAMIIGDVPSYKRNELLKECYGRSIRAYIVPKVSDVLIKCSSELNIFDTPLFLVRNEGLQIDQIVVKRLMDILFSSIGLILLSPVILVIALFIKFTDGGPVFYKQSRLTLNGKIFCIYKFRTMVQNAEKVEGISLVKENDERILPIGRILRATRLDELPQLYNILIGEMSLVGPRPERPELAKNIEDIFPEFSYRLKVKAGLTGYAQIYGKYNTTSYDKLKLDLIYISKYSFWLDMKLILMTPKVMLMKSSTEGVK